MSDANSMRGGSRDMAELMTERVWGRGLRFPRREKGDRKWEGKDYFGGRIVTRAGFQVFLEISRLSFSAEQFDLRNE